MENNYENGLNIATHFMGAEPSPIITKKTALYGWPSIIHDAILSAVSNGTSSAAIANKALCDMTIYIYICLSYSAGNNSPATITMTTQVYSSPSSTMKSYNQSLYTPNSANFASAVITIHGMMLKLKTYNTVYDLYFGTVLDGSTKENDFDFFRYISTIYIQ